MKAEQCRFLVTAAAVAFLALIYEATIRQPAIVQAALTHYHAFEMLDTAATETAVHDVTLLEPMPTGTVQLIVTGTPTSCTYQLLGRLRDGTGYDVLAEITGTECTNGRLVHFESKAVDVVRGRLDAIAGGTNPTVTGLLKMVTR